MATPRRRVRAATSGEQSEYENAAFTSPLADPTNATSAIILRESHNVERVLTTRLDAMDKAVAVFSENLTRVPTQLDKEIGRLKDLVMEMFKTIEVKFDGVHTEFSLRDVQRVQTAVDSKVAVDAAFAAQKEAAAKQDEANQKAIDKSEKQVGDTLLRQSELFRTTTDGLFTQITDLKERFGRMEISVQLLTAQAQTNATNIAALTQNMNKDEGRGDSVHIQALAAQIGVLTQSMHEGAGRYQQREVVTASSISNTTFLLMGMGLFVSIVIGIAGIIIGVR